MTPSRRSRDPTTERSPKPPWWTQLLLGLLLLGLGAMLLYSLVALWPAAAATGDDRGANPTVHWLGGTYSPSAGTTILLLVVVVGALGGYLRAVVGFADDVGNRTRRPAWSSRHLLRIGIGAALAVLAYLAARGLLFAGSDVAGIVNPAGIAAIAALVGLCGTRAAPWLGANAVAAPRAACRWAVGRVKSVRELFSSPRAQASPRSR